MFISTDKCSASRTHASEPRANNPLSPILNHETRHALKLFAVAGYQSSPKAERLGRDEGIEHSNRRPRDGDPHFPVGVHYTVVELEYVEWRHHLGEQMFVARPKMWLTDCVTLDPVLQFAQGDDGEADLAFAMSEELVTYSR